MKLISWTCFFALVLLCQIAKAELPDGYSVSEITPHQFLFENPKQHSTVLVNFDAVDIESDDAESYIRSSRYLQDARNSRRAKAMGFGEGDPFSFGASREQFASQWMGVSEYMFMAGDRSALVTERWYVRNGWAFTILISTVGNQTASPESHQQIFKAFAEDLGLKSDARSALFSSLIPPAFAEEIGRSKPNPARPRQATQASSNNQPVNCQAEAASLGIKSNLARSGAPAIHPKLSGTECLAGAKRVLDDAKTCLADGVAAAQRLGSKVAQRYQENEAYIDKQLGCRNEASRSTPSRAPVKVQRSDSESWSDWVQQTRIFKSAKAMTIQAGCAVARHVGAASMMEAQAAQAAYSAVKSGATTVVNGVVRASKAALYYADPRTQIRLGTQFFNYVKNVGDPAVAVFQFLEKNSRGFTCLKDAEQTRVACKFITQTAAELAATAATGAAASAAVRALRASRALTASLEALETGTRVEQRAAAVRFAESSTTMSEAGRARSAERVLGRKLSAAEREAVQAAHVEGTSGVGKYSQAELRRKSMILKDAGFSESERARLMRTGVTGEVSAGERSLANTVLGANSERSAVAYRKEAEDYLKQHSRELSELDADDLTRADHVIANRPQLASDGARLLMRSISSTDLAGTETVSDAGGRYLRMMQLASHAGSSTADDAGQMMARVIEELPQEKRGDFLQSLNNSFSSENRVLHGERPPPKTGTYGRDVTTVINSTYRNVVTNAMGWHQPEDAKAIEGFFKRIDSASTQREALNELMSKPGMQGISVEDFKDLRITAQSAAARRAEISKAEESARKAEATRRAEDAEAKKSAEAARALAERRRQMEQYEREKSLTTTVPIGRLNGGQ